MAERARQLRRLALASSILLLACLLQLHQLTRDNRFLPDEAYFMTFARGAAVKGEWLLPGALDKPPLSIYLSALSMAAVGNTADAAGVLQLDSRLGEFAGKLPNVMLALLLTALMLRLAWTVFRDETASLLAGLLTALSPYSLAYGASAFTDMSLLIFSVAALCLALSRRWGMAGLALGLAFWSKQQAVFSALLLLALLESRGARRDWPRFLLPLAAACGALLLWDAARPETSIFLQAAANNAPATLIAEPASWLERLLTWLRLGGWLLGPPLLTALLIMLAALAGFRRGCRHWLSTGALPVIRAALILYGVAHVVINLNLYDRYLLLALPLVILLVAGGLMALIKSYARYRAREIIVGVILLGGIWTSSIDVPVGGERAHYSGIDELAEHLNSKPVATVIYDPWLGWQLGYYLGAWHDKRRVHYPTAEALVEGALALDEIGDRYLVAPLDQPHEAWLAALRASGFDVTQDYARHRFVVYRLAPPKASPPKD